MRFLELLREFPGIPRVAPRMAFSHRERFFSKLGVVPRFLKFPRQTPHPTNLKLSLGIPYKAVFALFSPCACLLHESPPGTVNVYVLVCGFGAQTVNGVDGAPPCRMCFRKDDNRVHAKGVVL